MTQEAAAINQPSLCGRFLRHIMHMPTWHRYVLIGAIGFVLVGIVGHVRQFIGGSPTQSGATIASPHSNFGDSADSATTESNPQPWYLSPRFLGIGGSVLGGFIIGWAMRLFVKTTMLIALAIAAVFSGLSYFRVMNIDFTTVHQQAGSDVSWLSDQAWRLKDIAISHLPVHAGGLFGMFLGFRRPRM